MGSVNFITHADVLQLIAKRTAEDCIIFLSGPTSRKTPLSLLRMKDVIAVNGSVQYLLNNNVKPFFVPSDGCSLPPSPARRFL